MALDVLAQGRIVERPRRHTNKVGTNFVTARAAVHAYGESALVGLIAFDPDVADVLPDLDVGDAVAFAEPATARMWDDKKVVPWQGQGQAIRLTFPCLFFVRAEDL